jgi:hypothetical protein
MLYIVNPYGMLDFADFLKRVLADHLILLRLFLSFDRAGLK